MSTTATSRFEAIRAAARGGAPSRFEQIRRAAAAMPIVPQTVPAIAADLIPGGNFYGEGLGGSFADSPYGPTGSPFQGERQNAATALRLMEADRLRSTPAADAVAAGLASGQDQGLGGAMVSAASGGALDALLAAGGTPSTDIARMAAQAGGQGSYPAARTVAGVAGQLAAIAPMGPLAPAVMGGIRRQNVMERTGGNEDAAMLAGAVGAASMLNPLGGVGANVAFNAAANPAATAAEELIAVRGGAEPTPDAEFNRQLLIDAAVGAGVPALQAGVPGAVRAGVGRWQERRASQAGMRAEGLRRYQEAYRGARETAPDGVESPVVLPENPVPDAPGPVLDGASPARLADAPPLIVAEPAVSAELIGLDPIGRQPTLLAPVDLNRQIGPDAIPVGRLPDETRGQNGDQPQGNQVGQRVVDTPIIPGDTAPPEVAARTPIERAPNGPSLQEEGRQEGLLIGSAPETVTGAGEKPAPGIRATQNVAQPRQFTKADIERRLVDAHQSMGFERPETDETAIISRKFTFPNRLPAEVRDIVESYPETRAVFRVGRGGGGEDYAAAVGWERVAAEARDLGGADVRRAKEFFASEPSINPEATFLATLHDNLPKSGAKKMQSVDPKTLPEGTRFKINGEEFRVEMDGSGEGRYKVLKDGDTYPDTPVDALDAIPVDRGTLESPGAKPRKTWQEKKREKAAAVVKPEPVAAKPEPVAEAKPAAVAQDRPELEARYRLPKPIEGKTGAKIVGYQWMSQMEEGMFRDRRVSDWSRKTTSEPTGRDIVHVYWVQTPDGETSVMGVGAAKKALGMPESRLRTIAEQEQRNQRIRAQQWDTNERSSLAKSATSPEQADAEYRKANSPDKMMWGTREQHRAKAEELFAASRVITKDGRYLRTGDQQIIDEYTARGWSEVEQPAARGKSSEVKATDTLDAIRRAADNWEAKARDSIKKRQLPRGRNTGGTTLPADLIDYATIAAARVVKAGVTGTRAIRDVVDRLLAEDGKAGVIDPAPIVRAVKSLAKGSREGGQYTPEAFERAMGAMQERMAPKAPPVKRTVNEATGVSSVEAATVKPSEALSAGMRKAKRAADQAWREATKVSRAEGRANLEALRLKMRADFKAKRMDHEAARAEAVKIAEGLPLRERGKLVRAITKATTPRRVLRLIEQAGRLLDAHEGRDQVRQLAKAVARKQLIKLDEETRLKVARAALGLPETAAVSMNIAQMRQAIKDASSLLLEAMGSKDSGAVSVARIQATDRTRKVVEVIHQFKRQNRVILAGKIADATRLRTELQGDVAKAKAPAFLRDREGSAAEPRRTPWLRRAIRTQLTNESVAMTIDGKYGGGGVAHRVLVENLWRGESAMNGQMRDFTQALDRIAKKHGMGSLGEAMSRVSGSLGRSTQQKIPVRLGNIREITLGQAMDLVAMDPATRAKVEAGNAISFATRPNERVVIDAADFKAIEDALTPQQKAMIRDVKALIESDLQPDLFAALRQIKGWEPERVLDYWPSARNRRLTEGRTDAYAGWSGVVDQHLEDAGFTQNRTGGDTPFLVRDFLNTAIDHARSTAAIIHLAEPIRSAEMVMLDPSTRTAMATKFGDDVPKRVEEMLREISSLGRYQPQSTAGKAVLGLTRNVSRALTSINYRSWARQLGGVATLATEMPLSAYRAGLAGAFGKGVFEDMTEASPFLWNRYAESPSMMLSGMGQIGDTGAAATAGKTLAAAGRSWRRGRVLEGSGVAMKALDAVRIASFFDSIAARVAWSGFKAEADRVLPNASPAERRAWAADQTEQVIRRTQNTFSVLDSSKFAQMARREPVLAPLAMFTGDSNKAFNLLYQAAGRGKKDFGKVAATRAINAAWGAAITGGAPLALYLLASAISGNDAGRERQKDRAVQRAGSQFVREIAGTALFGDKLVDLVAGALEGFNGRDPLETPAGGQIAQVVTGIGQIATGVLGRMDEDPERAEAASKRFAQGVERTILGTTTAFGLPIAPIVGDIKTARRAIRATVAEDLIDERRQLRRVPEDQRTDSQMERLAELDGWFTSHNELRRQIKELRDAGEDADAAALERELEPLAMEYKTQSARLATR